MRRAYLPALVAGVIVVFANSATSGAVAVEESVTTPAAASQDVPVYVPNANEAFASEEIQATSEFFGITAEAAKRRLASENEAIRLQSVAQAEWPADFAGVWLDTAGSDSIHVSFTKGNFQQRFGALQERSDLPGRLVGVVGMHSLAKLRQVQARIGSERDEVASGRGFDSSVAVRETGGDYALDIDVRTNRIQVDLRSGTDPERLQGDLRERYVAENVSEKVRRGPRRDPRRRWLARDVGPGWARGVGPSTRSLPT